MGTGSTTKQPSRFSAPKPLCSRGFAMMGDIESDGQARRSLLFSARGQDISMSRKGKLYTLVCPTSNKTKSVPWQSGVKTFSQVASPKWKRRRKGTIQPNSDSQSGPSMCWSREVFRKVGLTYVSQPDVASRVHYHQEMYETRGNK